MLKACYFYFIFLKFYQSKTAAVKQVSLENAEKTIDTLNKEVERINKQNKAVQEDNKKFEAEILASNQAVSDSQRKIELLTSEVNLWSYIIIRFLWISSYS